MSDDEIIGLKSTSIKFKKNIKFSFLFLLITYLNVFIYLRKYWIKHFFILCLFYFNFNLSIINLKNQPKFMFKMFKLNNFQAYFIYRHFLN